MSDGEEKLAGALGDATDAGNKGVGHPETSNGSSKSEETKAMEDDKPDADDGEKLVIDEADNESEEKEFEPTIDMMINDFDDERTMEEEEALESQEDEADEVSALEQEGDMPLEELLKLYNYGGSGPGGAAPTPAAVAPTPAVATEKVEAPGLVAKEKPQETVQPPSDSVEPKKKFEDTSSGEKRPHSSSEDEEEEVGKPKSGSSSPPPPKKGRSELAKFYEAAVEGRSLRSSAAGLPGEEEEEESDNQGDGESDDGRDYSWKKTIMIGPTYQASVPSGMSSYGDTLPYENEDKLLWNPHTLSQEEAEAFLARSQESNQTSGIGSLPLGTHVRDDEQALFLLLQCGYNSEEALRRRRMSAVPPADTMSLWSEEECRAFELGLRLYGKDFHMIQQQKVRTRSVGELVQFYYLWKKTERHDVFATATGLEKKKYALHPGTTDYMDRFIDEQDASRDRSSSPNYSSLLFGADSKKAHNPFVGSKGSENGDSSTMPVTSATGSNSPENSQSILAAGNGSSVQSVNQGIIADPSVGDARQHP